MLFVQFHCFYLFLTARERERRWILNSSSYKTLILMFVPTPTCTDINFHICVASINLLLSLFGPCLESQCTLCGEPEGEWASPFPKSSCHRHLPACCLLFGEGGKRSGGDALLQTHCSSVFRLKQEQQHRPVLRLQVERPNIIKITSLVSFTANHPDRSPAQLSQV